METPNWYGNITFSADGCRLKHCIKLKSHWRCLLGWFIAIGLALNLSSPAFGQGTASPPPVESTVQLAHPPGSDQTAPPLTLTLQDALQRARMFDTQYLSAATDSKISHEDVTQARAALLP